MTIEPRELDRSFEPPIWGSVFFNGTYVNIDKRVGDSNIPGSLSEFSSPVRLDLGRHPAICTRQSPDFSSLATVGPTVANLGFESGEIASIQDPLTSQDLPSPSVVGARLFILSWNLAGISNKMVSPEWCKFIDQYDIILFQETWALIPVYRVGFLSFHVLATKNPKGRPKNALPNTDSQTQIANR